MIPLAFTKEQLGGFILVILFFCVQFKVTPGCRIWVRRFLKWQVGKANRYVRWIESMNLQRKIEQNKIEKLMATRATEAVMSYEKLLQLLLNPQT
jgi:hypothetical protein